MPSNGFRKLTEGLSRAQTSILVQLRTGHIALNAYLHRITKADSPTCPSCNQDDETVHHFLFDCPTWRHERWQLSQALGWDSKLVTCVLNSLKGVKAVLKYVGRTGRLKSAER